jgi:hypothetical protein
MARYNTVISSASLAAASADTLTTPIAGQFTKFTGTTYGVTIGDPALFSGQSQTFYNSASGVITLTSGGSGIFSGPGSSGASTQQIPTASTLTLYSDGTNWITAFDGGGPLTATTGAFAGNLTNSTASISVFNGSTTVNAFTGATTASIGSLSTASSTTSLANGVTTSGATNTVNIAAQGASGSTTAINIGNVVSTTTATINGTLSFAGASSGTVKFIAPSTAGTQSYTLPTAVPAASGYALSSTTGGVLSWANVSPTVTDTTTNATFYPVFNSSTSGQLSTANIASSGITFNPSTNQLVVAGVVNYLRTENLQTTSYTLALTDRNRTVSMNPSGAATVTVPLNSSVAFPVGTLIYICNLSNQAVTLLAAGGVTLTKTGTLSQYEEITLRKRLSDTWSVVAGTTNASATQTGGTFTNTGSLSTVVYTTAGNTTGTFKAN